MMQPQQGPLPGTAAPPMQAPAQAPMAGGAAPPYRQLKVEDALAYLDQVKMKFEDKPEIYNQFLDVVHQSLLDSGISRPTTLANLAIRSDCVSSDCGKYLSFSSFCLRSDSK